MRAKISNKKHEENTEKNTDLMVKFLLLGFLVIILLKILFL